MKRRDMKQRDQDQPPSPTEKAKRGEAAFDLWLQRGLHQLYDSVAREPVPDDLLRLIEENRKK